MGWNTKIYTDEGKSRFALMDEKKGISELTNMIELGDKEVGLKILADF